MSHHENRVANMLRQTAELVDRYRLQLILSLRVTVAALLAYVLAEALHLRLPLWAVLTSLIVTQMSVGRSVKVTSDYLIGTFGGVVYGGALAILIPHDSEWALLAVLALAVAPLAFIASFRPNFNVLPVTAIIVLLVPGMQHVSPAASALDRVLEVTLGGAVGFIVSALLFPFRGHWITVRAAADMLDLMADALSSFLEDHARELDEADRRRIHDAIAAALARLNAAGSEAEHERSARLTSGPETGPLLRTLLRLRHDIVMLSRAVGCELPQRVAARLTPSLRKVETTTSDFLRASGAALRSRKPPPPLEAIVAAFGDYNEAFGAVRREGLTREIKTETTERFFALGFALEQLREHLVEVHRVVGEWAREYSQTTIGVIRCRQRPIGRCRLTCRRPFAILPGTFYGEKRMHILRLKRRQFIALLGAATAAIPLAGRAQQAAFVIGFLHQGSGEPAANINAFRKGLSEAGIDSQNVRIEDRAANGHYDRLPGLAAELVAARVAVIAANFLPAALAAKAATRTIPVVFLSGSDPIKSGLVSSINRPSENVTGIATMFTLLGTKNLELLHQLVPGTTATGVLANSTNPNMEHQLNELHTAARALGQELMVFPGSSEREIEDSFAAMRERRIRALVVTADGFLISRQDQIVALAARDAVPAMYPLSQYVLAGGLMSYGANLRDAFRQTGIYVGRVLKGMKPEDLPVLQPTKVEFVINLKAVKALGLEVPAHLLALADEVIE